MKSERTIWEFEFEYYSLFEKDGRLYAKDNDGNEVLLELDHLKSLLHSRNWHRDRIKKIDARMRDWPEPASEEAINIIANGTHSLAEPVI